MNLTEEEIKEFLLIVKKSPVSCGRVIYGDELLRNGQERLFMKLVNNNMEPPISCTPRALSIPVVNRSIDTIKFLIDHEELCFPLTWNTEHAISTAISNGCLEELKILREGYMIQQ